MMISVLISRSFLYPDILINCNDYNLAVFICKLYSPFAKVTNTNTNSYTADNYYVINIEKTNNEFYVIQCQDLQAEIQENQPVQVIENIIYTKTYSSKTILPLHGAAVACKSSAFLLLGQTASGKSTLCSYLINKGFDYITDDIIHIEKNSMNLLPFRKAVSLRSGGLAVLYDKYKIIPENIEYLKWGNIERYCYTPAVSNCLPKYSVHSLLFIKRSKTENSSSHIEMPRSFVSFMKNLYIYKKTEPDDIKFICKFLQNVDCYQIIYNEMEYVMERILHLINDNKFK